MDTVEITAIPRVRTGGSSARTLRSQGQLPAILYGPAKTTRHLSVEIKPLEKVLQKQSSGQIIFNLQVADNGASSKHFAMIRELQVHPVSRRWLHADFYEIAMDRKITATVPVVAVGHCQGVEDGGMLQIIRRELEVWCLPMAIPEAIEVDVSRLNVGDSVHVAELPLPEAVEIPYEVNFTILTVLGAQKEAVSEESEGAEGEGGSETAAE